MKPTRYAYVCEVCGRCVVTTQRSTDLLLVCQGCLVRQKFLLCAIVIDYGMYEEWERI